MARTSSNLTAGKALNGHDGNGKGSRGRAAGLVASAALGLALLVGVVFSQARPAARPTDAQAGSNPVIVEAQFAPDQFTYREDHRSTGASGTQIWTGTCRAGGSDCLPEEEIVVPAPTVDRPQGWTGTCRPNSIDCLPDEELAVGATTHGTVPADEDEWTSDGVNPGFVP